MKHKLPYMKHMWQWRSGSGRFICLRRGCAAKCKTVIDPKTSKICRKWDQGKKRA